MPRSVPWDFVEPFRAQALRNHSQTLERLAARGGLAPEEIHAAAHRKDCCGYLIDEQVAIDWLVASVAAWEAANG
jgi:hypothetical protein